MKIEPGDVEQITGRVQRLLPDTDRDRYDRAYELGREGSALTVLFALGAGLGFGLLLMWLLDPDAGARRRSMIAGRASQVRAIMPTARPEDDRETHLGAPGTVPDGRDDRDEVEARRADRADAGI